MRHLGEKKEENQYNKNGGSKTWIFWVIICLETLLILIGVFYIIKLFNYILSLPDNNTIKIIVFYYIIGTPLIVAFFGLGIFGIIDLFLFVFLSDLIESFLRKLGREKQLDKILFIIIFVFHLLTFLIFPLRLFLLNNESLTLMGVWALMTSFLVFMAIPIFLIIGWIQDHDYKPFDKLIKKIKIHKKKK